VGLLPRSDGRQPASGARCERRTPPAPGPRCRARRRVGTLRAPPRAGGGIGRRARFRSVCPNGHGGSSPPSPTTTPHVAVPPYPPGPGRDGQGPHAQRPVTRLRAAGRRRWCSSLSPNLMTRPRTAVTIRRRRGRRGTHRAGPGRSRTAFLGARPAVATGGCPRGAGGDVSRPRSNAGSVHPQRRGPGATPTPLRRRRATATPADRSDCRGVARDGGRSRRPLHLLSAPHGGPPVAAPRARHPAVALRAEPRRRHLVACARDNRRKGTMTGAEYREFLQLMPWPD
jgi:hypothetical protein